MCASSLGPTRPTRLAGPVFEWDWPRPDSEPHSFVPDAVTCYGSGGEIVSIDAFADGDRWRARVACYTPGEWRWEAGSVGGSLDSQGTASSRHWPDGPLRMSVYRRHLVSSANSPFFYLADTAWFIVLKGTPDQWAEYLDLRNAQGYSVIQLILLPLRWGLADVEGNEAFLEDDPQRPNAAYFRRFDRFIVMAAQRGFRIFLSILWGGPRKDLPASHFTTDEARAFTRYAVARYAAFPMIWSISGDAPYVHEMAKWEAVGETVEAADPYAHPTTNHLCPSMNWHFLFHDSKWHDFHMLQTGHYHGSANDIRDLPTTYYRHQSPKAVVNGEPWYEAHPCRDTQEYGPLFTAYDARYAFWIGVLSGTTMGHTYGSQGVWNWKRPGDGEEHFAGPQIGPVWSDAIRHDGAHQVGAGARWLRCQPWWRLEPCPGQAEIHPSPTDCAHRPAHARVPDELHVVYQPVGLGCLTLKGVEPGDWQAAWLDPRTGQESLIGEATPGENLKWTAPEPPTREDWVLILRRGAAFGQPPSSQPFP